MRHTALREQTLLDAFASEYSTLPTAPQGGRSGIPKGLNAQETREAYPALKGLPDWMLVKIIIWVSVYGRRIYVLYIDTAKPPELALFVVIVPMMVILRRRYR